ncbi:MAG: DUF2199 domain-containing protein [Bradyrhizobium sp.]|nr:DUF2199 domain-containing protein [Bradyrhizobium sp.]
MDDRGAEATVDIGRTTAVECATGYYPDTLGLNTLAHPKPNGQRPMITLEPTDHPLAVDFRDGLTIERAQQMAEQLMHRSPTS